ncbi:MAG: hypothetical protein L0Z55_05895 [Planctomycetes bacterium]|nr:hypothetical protein [Planctomycetota bacterium]
MKPFHPGLAAGRWHTFSLAAQLANVGSEMGRALVARAAGDTQRMDRALDRGLELLDLTIVDPRYRGRRRRELCRVREVVCDFFFGDNEFGSTPELIDRYFMAFAIDARRQKLAETTRE